jgi:hypothetical protein|nr:MAG TPA_asm: Protein of unknown function (DUF3139) [Caudoviricetes sp.]
MKKKIVYVTLALALIAGAFLLGRNMPSKYDYLNLNQIASVKQFIQTQIAMISQ